MYSFVDAGPTLGGAKSEKAVQNSFEIGNTAEEEKEDVVVKAKSSKIIGFSKPDWVKKITHTPSNDQIERNQQA